MTESYNLQKKKQNLDQVLASNLMPLNFYSLRLERGSSIVRIVKISSNDCRARWRNPLALCWTFMNPESNIRIWRHLTPTIVTGVLEIRKETEERLITGKRDLAKAWSENIPAHYTFEGKQMAPTCGSRLPATHFEVVFKLMKKDLRSNLESVLRKRFSVQSNATGFLSFHLTSNCGLRLGF